MTDPLRRARRALGDRRADPTPYVLGAAAITAGVLLTLWSPRRADLPAARRAPRLPDRDAGSALRETREAVAAVTPDNAAAGIGRSLVFIGAGLVTVTLLDALGDRNAR